jgi:hypothetical protein
MAHPRLARSLALALGLLYLAAGLAESVRAVSSGDGGLWFWCGSLVGGGVLVLAGLRLRDRRPEVGRSLVCVGAVMGILATGWTVVVPVLALAVVVLELREPRQPE